MPSTRSVSVRTISESINTKTMVTLKDIFGKTLIERPDLDDFKGFDFSDMDLQYADFSGMDLTGARFHNCNLENALFIDAVITGCDFSWTYLSEADFEGSNSDDADFGLADIVNSSLYHMEHIP